MSAEYLLSEFSHDPGCFTHTPQISANQVAKGQLVPPSLNITDAVAQLSNAAQNKTPWFMLPE